MITAREDKRLREWALTGIVKTHPLYADFRPVKIRVEKPAPPAPVLAAGPAPLEITERYTPSHHAAELFRLVGRDGGGYFEASEVVQVLKDYIARESLDDPDLRVPDRSFIFIDTILENCLFKGYVKKGDPIPRTMKKAEASDLFVVRLLYVFLG